MKKFHIANSLVLGLFSVFSLCVLDVSAELSVRDDTSSARDIDPLAAPAGYIHTNLQPDIFVKSASSRRSRLVKRARRWTREEEELLLDLRDRQEKSWEEIMTRIDRSWKALEGKYFLLTNDPAVRKTDVNENPKKWTQAEREKLVRLKEEENLPWAEIAEQFSERDVGALKNQYNYIKRGDVAPAGTYRRWTAEEDSYLLELGEEGLSWDQRFRRFNSRFRDFPKSRTLGALQARYSNLTRSQVVKKGRYTTKEDADIVEALSINMSVDEIAELLGRGRLAVYARIRKLEDEGRVTSASRIASNRSYTDEEIALIIRLRNEGMSWKDIAAIHFKGRSEAGVKGAYWRYFEQEETDEANE